MVPGSLTDIIADHLGTPVLATRPVGGGCIAQATRVQTDTGPYFLKYGRGSISETFPAEARGLRALQGSNSPLFVPSVLLVRAETSSVPGFLLLEWVEQGAPSSGFWASLGRGLAQLHRHTADRYGFEQDNYIGRTPQRNAWESSWPLFFRTYRLAPQVALARAKGRWQERWDGPLIRLYERLDHVLPATPDASLLHGDLWSGNVIVDTAGRAVLIDPAVYYGHREADLAMTELFGGFALAFYDAYREAWPLEPGYAQRRDLYNLYHLLNHLNLFGGGYAGSVWTILQRYGGV